MTTMLRQLPVAAPSARVAVCVAAEFEKAGLADQVCRGTGRAPGPMLRETLESRQRMIVMAQ
jgi:hypothetical protein